MSKLPGALSDTQKRLIHQLIAAEYPTLKSRHYNQLIQVEKIEPKCDRNVLEEKAKAMETQIKKHVGCRWIIEALVGGDLTDLEPQIFQPLMSKAAEQKFTVTDLARQIKKRMKINRPVLVGHNCFMDLVFLYSCFLGTLPDTVEEFQNLIHEALPIVIDTKYLATHDCGSANKHSSLEEVNRLLARISVPTISM